MKIELKYFTGTGNSYKIINTCKELFKASGCVVDVSAVNDDKPLCSKADIIGFCFPVYAFGIPRICCNYLKQIDKFIETKKVFVIITAGDADESGFAVNECVDILKKKNCDIIYTSVIQMPANWTTGMNPPTKDEAQSIIDMGIKNANLIAHDILTGIKKYHTFNVPKNYGTWGLYKEYYLFKLMGLRNLWRCFRVYESCNNCKLCAKICPTNSIEIVNNKPVWSSTCEQCMRCVNFCPNEAIYQTHGGDTKGRNKYFEPSFKPFHKTIELD